MAAEVGIGAAAAAAGAVSEHARVCMRRRDSELVPSTAAAVAAPRGLANNPGSEGSNETGHPLDAIVTIFVVKCLRGLELSVHCCRIDYSRAQRHRPTTTTAAAAAAAAAARGKEKENKTAAVGGDRRQHHRPPETTDSTLARACRCRHVPRPDPGHGAPDPPPALCHHPAAPP